MLVPFSKVM